MHRSNSLLNYPFEPGELVSTEKRFRSFAEYRTAVERYGGTCVPGEHSYSIWLPGDKELLLMHQPSINLPTGRDIEFKFLPETNLTRFQNLYNDMVKYQGYENIEFPDNRSLRGNRDRSNTYRAILRPRQGIVGDYQGYIINPPYPAKKRINKQSGQTKWLLPALLGLATGLAAVPLLRALRAQSDE